jgi:hypothetical protein
MSKCLSNGYQIRLVRDRDLGIWSLQTWLYIGLLQRVGNEIVTSWDLNLSIARWLDTDETRGEVYIHEPLGIWKGRFKDHWIWNNSEREYSPGFELRPKAVNIRKTIIDD